jgi:hypothetical protein
MGLLADIFDRKPPPGQCDGGWLIECCTSVQGETTCRPPGWNLLAGKPSGGGAFGIGEANPALEELSPQEGYIRARELGYTGSPADFAAEWEAYQKRKAEGLFPDEDDDTDWTTMGWVVLGLVAGAGVGYLARRKR